MRVIKFRAWHSKGKGEMLYGTNRSVFSWQEEGQPITIMQFTGLLDRNGKEIYEGDILKLEPLHFIEEDAEQVGVVEFDNKRGAFNIIGQIQVHPNSNWEIIGNIFENPELLTK
jgi:hypothetical protein